MNYFHYKDLSVKKKAKIIAELLEEEYPDVTTPLLHKNEFELLIATILSTQTNDNTTNKVTPVLFRKYPTPRKLSEADPSDIEPMIRLINYHKTKAKNIVKASRMLLSEFNGKVPSKMADLIKLPGVGRKVANVVINEWFVKKAIENDKTYEPEGFVIDTHVLRVSKRLGLTKHSTPEKVEKDLMKLFPRNEWAEVSLRLIFHGRQWSQAKNPKFFEHPNNAWHEIYKSMGS